MKIEHGTSITVKILEWHEEHWEFDRPIVILSPVIRYSPNGESAEYMAEDLGIDACLDGEIKDHDYTKEFEWRGWNIKYLNKVYNQCRKGKKFPNKQYKATEYLLRFSWNNQEGLVFSMEKVNV